MAYLVVLLWRAAPFLVVFVSFAASAAVDLRACPAAAAIPQVTIDVVDGSGNRMPAGWQVLLDGVPLGEAQVAALARDDLMIERTMIDLDARGKWVFSGLVTAAVGVAISRIIFGRNGAQRNLAFGAGLGGIVLGAVGMLIVTETVQSSLASHVAPTSRHRLSRTEMRGLVETINRRIYRRVCVAAKTGEKVMMR